MAKKRTTKGTKDARRSARKAAKKTTRARRGTTPAKAPPRKNVKKKTARKRVVKVATTHLPKIKETATRVTSDKTKKTKTSRKRTPIRIGGHKVARGTEEHILLKISEHYTHQGVYIPVTVIRGKRPGPRLYLTAAVHGDEVNGVQIIREVINQVNPETLRGTLVAVPVVNRFGFVSHTRYMPDRRDLNRGFPGNPEGSTTARVAHIVFEEIVRPCDFGIDLHTAGYHRSNLPQIRGDMTDADVRKMAKAFGAEVILDSVGLKSTLRRTATEQGVPTIIYEAGETFRFQRAAITKGVTGVLNVLKALKMLPGPPERPRYQVIVKTSEWVRAAHGGILETVIEAGTLVYKGDTLAHISNPFGRAVDHVQAPFNGIVVGVTTLPMVNPGAPICHLVKLKKTLKTVEQHHTDPPAPVDPMAGLVAEELPYAPVEEEDVEG